MLFNSLQFIIFFPIVVLLFYLSPARFRWILLLISSYIFYMAWKPAYILLIVLSTIIDYLCGLKMGKIEIKEKRRPFLYISLFSNLGILFAFKYLNFFTENINSLILFGGNASFPILDVILPVGISFYTFQTMSYSIDIYNGKIQPENHLGKFALFVAFFPQLVAGPIERAGNMLGQFKTFYAANYSRIVLGLQIMMIGFFKKVVVADNVALLVNQVYNNPGQYEGVSTFLATIFFAFQIYCDFSGYSDIAIGSALILGITLMENFRRPYYSKSIGEFWKRWHISLSSWFRDYVYIPLGGNRVIKWRWYYNLFITFMVSGFWHGANWTFILWGSLHGLYLIFGHLLAKPQAAFKRITGISKFVFLEKLFDVSVTFILVCFAWIFFRANSLPDAIIIIQSGITGLSNVTQMFNPEYIDHIVFLDQGKYVFIVSVLSILLLELIELYQRGGSVFRHISKKPAYIRWAVYYVILIIILVFGSFNQTDFIYFQF